MNKAFDIKQFFLRDYLTIPITVICFIWASVTINYFATPNNILNIFIQMSDLLIISLGLMMVILNGGIDFSVTAVMGLGSILGALVMNKTDGFLMDSPYGWLVGILIILAIGVAIGVINGIAVVYLKMPSFMATMATFLCFAGLALYIANSKPISNLPRNFLFIGNGWIFDIVPFPIIMAAVVVFIMYLVLHRSVYGRNVYAIGTNPQAASISGLPVKKTVFMLFIFSSVLAAIGGMITSARLSASMPDLNKARLLDFVTVVIFGGTSPFGGKGTVLGTVIGAFFISMLSNALSMMNLQWFDTMFIKGLFLLGIIVVTAINAKRESI